MRRKLLTSVALVGSLMALSACGSADAEPTTASTASAEAAGASQAAPQQGGDGQGGSGVQPGAEGSPAAMPEPDLEGIPDVVATVNGEEISGKDFSGVYESRFQQLAMQAQMSGQELDQDAMKKQTVDSMVGSELLVQDAEANGHEATDEDVDALLEETVKAQQLGSVDELMAVYEEQGFAEEQVRSDARKQVLMTAAIEEIDVPEPSEEELRELYDQAAAAQPPAEGGEASGAAGASAQAPSFEELKPQLEQQVAAQKQNEAIMQRMEELRKDADVEVRI
ncbi:MAG: SurA N-terminal domain-containing protein [Micrococcus sp.]|nr:SurA N-terminal domain-containing protein [Micrococcus sp.]